jgi:hypothetical protein
MNLPRWRCHKVVGACKIKSISTGPDSCMITAEEEHVGTFPAPPGWLTRALSSLVSDIKGESSVNELFGGYFVQYDDGYCSWSPAEAFEDGYTPVDTELVGGGGAEAG